MPLPESRRTKGALLATRIKRQRPPYLILAIIPLGFTLPTPWLPTSAA